MAAGVGVVAVDIIVDRCISGKLLLKIYHLVPILTLQAQHIGFFGLNHTDQCIAAFFPGQVAGLVGIVGKDIA